MKTVVFYNGRILAQDGELPQGYVLVENGLIQRVQAGTPPSEWTNVERIDLKGNILSPGFIDLHTHGAGGCDFMDGTQQAVITAARMHLRHGTTSLCPTSMASNDEDLFRFFDCYRQAKDVRNAMPHLLGIHLEGPYFSPNQAGAQPPEYMKKPYPEHAQTVLEHAQGDVVRWSCAPEVEGVLELGSLLQEQGILASIAHSDADYALVQRAIEHGFVHLPCNGQYARGRNAGGRIRAGEPEKRQPGAGARRRGLYSRRAVLCRQCRYSRPSCACYDATGGTINMGSSLYDNAQPGKADENRLAHRKYCGRKSGRSCGF